MSVAQLEILVEELSMEAALRLIVPKIIGDLPFDVYPYQCKDDLLSKLPARLRGYAAWMPEDYRILVIVDRDDDDCEDLKQQLEKAASDAGLVTKTKANGQVYHVVNRLAIEELEAWYFGDWEAVRAAYPRVDSNLPQKAGYRDSDAVSGGTWEAFEKVLQKARYFKNGLRKIEAARTVAEHMEPRSLSEITIRQRRINDLQTPTSR
jgi:hypothetical protein